MTRPRARLIAFFALVSFGALQWMRLLDPAPVGRTIWFLLAAVVAGIGLRWCNRLERRRRWFATAGIAFVLVLVALLLAGVPFSLVEPRGWGDLVSGLNQGVGTLPSMRIPYRGAEPWAHSTLVFIGYLLVALATALACLPRGDARPRAPRRPAGRCGAPGPAARRRRRRRRPRRRALGLAGERLAGAPGSRLHGAA